LSDIPEYCCIAFVFDSIEFKPDRRKKIHSVIEEKAKIIEISAQGQSDLINWIRRRFRHNGKNISRETAEYLIFYCGDLMTGLISEIEKLSAYVRSDSVAREDIEAVAVPVPDAVAFNMLTRYRATISESGGDPVAAISNAREPRINSEYFRFQMRKLYLRALPMNR
jgi:DNA polymerase-3 subunit delta